MMFISSRLRLGHLRRQRVRSGGGQRASVAAAATTPSVAVIGGGMAGLGAAQTLTDAGVAVTLIEQGRGLGGRVCSRRTTVNGADVTLDHGAQYLTAKTPEFEALLQRLEAAGVVARWGGAGGGCQIGDVRAGADGRVEPGSFAPYAPSKRLFVGVPSMSAVGRALAADAAKGASLDALLGTHVAALRKCSGGGGGGGTSAPKWRLSLEARAPARGAGSGSGSGGGVDAAAVEAREFDAVITAMSANSTRRLLEGVFDAAAADAAAVKANVCWALMLVLSKPTGLPFDGALVTNAPGAPECPLAWFARDSSKPGRSLPPGAAETWVLHAAPDFSNALGAAATKADAAAALLRALPPALGLDGADIGRAALYVEAHAWSNAYPLNCRDPAGPAVDRGARLAACGDWTVGPRAGDAWASGRAAAREVLELL